MNDEETVQFGDRLQALWPHTSEPIGLAVLGDCEQYGLPIVLQAMDELRAAMPSHHRMVDRDRLQAICRRLAGETTPTPAEPVSVARTASYLAWMESERAKREAEFARIDQQLELTPQERREQLVATATERCAKRYANIWGAMRDAARARLVKIEIAGMAEVEA